MILNGLAKSKIRLIINRFVIDHSIIANLVIVSKTQVNSVYRRFAGFLVLEILDFLGL